MKYGKNITAFMKRHSFLIKVTTAICCVALFACSVPAVPVEASKLSDLEDKLKKAKEEKAETQGKIKENEEELSGLQDTKNGLNRELNSLNANLEEVCNNLSQLEDQIDIKMIEIEIAEAELEEALEIENEQYESMKKRIQYMYERRDFVVLETLFASGSFAEFLNRNNYIESLAAYDRMKLEEFKATREMVEEAKAKLEEEKENLEALKVEVEAEQSRVQGLVSQTSGKIAEYQKEIKETEQEIEDYENQLAEQNANIAAIQKEIEEERRLSELAARSAWRDISQVSFAEGDRYLLANLIYCEAGNQPFQGQVAVGAVVMNRVMSSVFPDTVTGVIYQRKQFSPVGSGRLALALSRDDATAACYAAADAAMQGQTTVGNCLFFRTPIEGLTGIQIGGHIFY